MDRYVHVGKLRLHYLDHPGNGQTLVLMPGLTANAHSFDGLTAAGLSPAVRVLALDLRGRGLSDKPSSGYAMHDHALDVLNLLDALGIESVILGGHSFGGLLSMYMAAHFPERITKLVVIDAAGAMHPRVMDLIKPSIDRLGRTTPSWDAYLQSMKAMPFYEGWWDPTIESYYRADVDIRSDGSVKPRSRPEAILESVTAALSEDWAAHLSKIGQPLLLLNALGPFGPAGAPPVLPRQQALETVEAVADGHYVEIPGNHMTMLYGDGAKKMVSEIIAFATP
jgi:pimeloyl-ACP methyl ester carboxylesterase